MSDDFNNRYRLLKCIAVDEGIRTHNAQELKTGRVVMIHLADAAGPEEVEKLRAQIGQLSITDKNRVLETATLASGFAVVTEFVSGLNSFPAWLRQRAVVTESAEAGISGSDNTAVQQTIETAHLAPVIPLAPSTPVAPLEPPEAETRAPGEFTLMFGKPSIEASVPESINTKTEEKQNQSNIGAVPVPEPKPAIEPTKEPGEFTRLFAAPSTAAPLPASPPKSQLSAASPSSSIGPSVVPPPNFSAPIFPSPSPSSFSAAPAPTPTPTPSVFPILDPSPINPVHASHPATPLSIPQSTPASSSPDTGSEPVSPIFGDSPAILPPPIFSAGSQTPLSPLGGAQSPGSPKGASAAAPSDFTRMISKAAAPSAPPKPATPTPIPSATPAKQKRGIPMPLIIIINLVIIAAIALIMYAITRRTPTLPSTPAVPSVPTAPATPNAGAAGPVS